MARIQITPPAASARATVFDLLTRQMQEHDIGIADQALLAAIDGVFADDRRGLFLLALMTRLSEDTPPPLRTTENSHRRTV